MSEPNLDHPGEISWYKGYRPAPVLGLCPHAACPHDGQSVMGWGPSYGRYELVQCDSDCDGRCRAWVDERGRVTTAWRYVDTHPRRAALPVPSPVPRTTGTDKITEGKRS